MRKLLAVLLCSLALAGCGVTASAPVAVPHPAETILSPPDPTPTDGQAAAPTGEFPPRPSELDAYMQAITDFLNAAPENHERLESLLTEWNSHLAPPSILVNAFLDEKLTEAAAQRSVQEADLDGDQQAEILVAASSPDVSARSALLIFEQTAAGRYQPFVREYATMAIRLWRIEDINRDGGLEILIQAADCGAHTCHLYADIMQWTGEDYRSLLQSNDVNTHHSGSPGVMMPSAQATLRDSDGDGVQDLVLEGGLVQSVGAGLQRSRTHVYIWDGQIYQLREVIYDPVASQHPFFKLIDGNAAMAAGNNQAAVHLYEAAIATPFPPPESGVFWEESEPAMVAFARFRLLLATVRLGNIDQATAIYQTAQAEDADYAVWSRAFWEAYQDSGNVDDGCQATIAATRSPPALLEPLNSFGYANPTFEAGDLCPTVEQ